MSSSSLVSKATPKDDSHLGIEDARLGLDHVNFLVEALHRVHVSLAIFDRRRQPQCVWTWRRNGGEGIAEALLGAGGDGDGVFDGGEVPDDLLGGWMREGAADESDGDGRGFIVGDGQEGLVRAAVDELDAEDLGGGKGGFDGDGEVGGGGWRFERFLDVGLGKQMISFDLVRGDIFARSDRSEVNSEGCVSMKLDLP